MRKLVVCFTLILIGCASAGTASWSEDISVHNNRAVTGIHYSQHESSVNAARRAAADRLNQHQAAALVASGGPAGPCDTICYNSYTADAGGDTETVGLGTVGFAPVASGVGSSQKYSSSSSRHESNVVSNVHGTPVVYPAVGSTGSRSSFSSSSSSRQHSASLNGAQPVVGQLYSADVDAHGRTVTRDGTYVQPVAYSYQAPQTQSSQTSYQERSNQERSVVSRPAVVTSVVYTAAPVAGASHSSSNYATRSNFATDQQQQLVQQPVAYQTANGAYTRQYVSAQNQDHQYRQGQAPLSNTYVVYTKPQYYTTGRSRTEDAAASHQTTYDSSGRLVNLNVAQPTTHAERLDEQRSFESSQTVQRQPDQFHVRASYDQQEHDTHGFTENLDLVEQGTPRPVVAGSSISVANAQRRQQAGSVRTGTSYVSNAGTGNRYASSAAQSADSQRRVTYQRGPDYVPVGTAASNLESASEQHHQHVSSQAGNSYVVPIVVQPIPQAIGSTASRYSTSSSSSSSSSSNAQEHRANQQTAGAGHGVYHVGSGLSQPSYGASQYSSNSQTHSNSRYRGQGQQGGSFVHYPIANDGMGRQFGATGGSGGYGADTDLQDIMSESETLARLQAQNVHNGAVTGSATIDAEQRFGSGSDADGLGTLPGGFQRTKSWSSSSKWASEQRYGDDGKPKTYSMLSTAESEKHNINGKTTGYKAATTTLEDDGKVSTYSLHTT